MTTETEHDTDAPVQPRVRTLKAAQAEEQAAPQPTEQQEVTPADVSPTIPEAATPAEADGETKPPKPGSGDGAIHAGWTAGQQVMDSTSSYAQALQIESKLMCIKILDDQPYANFRRHWVERMTPEGVKKRPYTCLETVGRDCPLCNIADSPQAVSAFNVAVVGDDGQLLLKTWDVGAKLFNVLKAYATDPLVGPLTRDFFLVNKTGGGGGRGKGGQVQTNVTPVKTNRLEEDYGLVPPTEEALRRVGKYDQSVVQIPKFSDLEEIAEEISDYN